MDNAKLDKDETQQTLPPLTIHVKHGKDLLPVSLPPSASIRDLMEKLQHLTNVLPRAQKLIFKGKVIDVNMTLKSANLQDGCKVMLMASQGVHQKTASVVQKEVGSVKTAKLQLSCPQNEIAVKTRLDTWRATGIISLRDSGLQVIPSELWSLGLSARVLDVGGNYLLCFPDAVSSLSRLQKLRLSFNGFIDGKIQWQGLTTLKHLTVLALDHNLLTHVPAEVGQLCSLKLLSVSHNKLEHVAKEIGSLCHLEKMDLSHNCLTILPPVFGQCPYLIEINLSSNLLKELPSTLGNLKKLKVLGLVNNALKGFPSEILRGCVELSTLSLHGNELTLDELRMLDGWAEFDERRKSKYSKQLDFNVMGSSSGFDEGADSQQWQHW